MTEQHPITPPLELVNKWGKMLEYCEETDVFSDIARWGADQELKACCAWVGDGCAVLARDLRDARRPKPLSLKQQALEWCNDYIDPDGVIRRALEQLDD